MGSASYGLAANTSLQGTLESAAAEPGSFDGATNNHMEARSVNNNRITIHLMTSSARKVVVSIALTLATATFIPARAAAGTALQAVRLGGDQEDGESLISSRSASAKTSWTAFGMPRSYAPRPRLWALLACTAG